MVSNTEFLSVVRVNSVMRLLDDARNVPQELKFLRRTKIVPATNGELMAEFTGRVNIADLVADDAPANVYQTGRFIPSSSTHPNIKHGVNMGQEMLDEMDKMSDMDIKDPDGIFRQWQRRTLEGILEGIRHRQEALLIAMFLNEFDYDAYGITMSGVTWGAPSDLHVTPSPAWTNVASTTIDDIFSLMRVARVRYGQTFDRMTLSLTAFNYLIATTQFKEYVRSFGLLTSLGVASSSPLPLTNTGIMKDVATTLLGLKEIEIYDARYWHQEEDGTWRSRAFLPINEVIFTSTADDNNDAAFDFSSGIVTESIVGSLLPNAYFGQFPSKVRGPVGYVTPQNFNMNPPGLTWWGVMKGWPRRHKRQLAARMTVGTFTDTIAVAEPTFV